MVQEKNRFRINLAEDEDHPDDVSIGSGVSSYIESDLSNSLGYDPSVAREEWHSIKTMKTSLHTLDYKITFDEKYQPKPTKEI